MCPKAMKEVTEISPYVFLTGKQQDQSLHAFIPPNTKALLKYQ